MTTAAELIETLEHCRIKQAYWAGIGRTDRAAEYGEDIARLLREAEMMEAAAEADKARR